MVWVGTADRTQHLTGILLKTGSALDEVFQYYKFGRYGNAFSGKPYFLLSHCAHLLFSLGSADEDGGGDLFRRAPGPAAFLAELDFGPLRGADYNRPTHDADFLDDRLKGDPKGDESRLGTQNEPRWFQFWMGLLERLYPRETQSHWEFTQRVLTCVGYRGFLEGKGARKNKKTLDDLMKTVVAGRILLRTMSILENVMRVITSHVATLDAKTCTAAQATALACLLNQIRRTIVCEGLATGPYVPRGAKSWRMPPSLARLHFGATEGTLMLVPKREGGEIICSYDWMSKSVPKRRSWMVKTSALKRTYEQELFATWSCETGEYLQDPGRFPQTSGSWIVQNAEADRLENLSRQVDLVLDALRANPACRGLVAAVVPLLRNAATRWKATELPWTYVGQLDKLLDKLAFVCREAKVLSGDNPIEQVLRQSWPAQHAMKVRARRESKAPRPHEATADKSQAETATDKHSVPGQMAGSEQDQTREDPTERPQPSSGETMATENRQPESVVQQDEPTRTESHTRQLEQRAEPPESDDQQEPLPAEDQSAPSERDPGPQPAVEETVDWDADAHVSQEAPAPDDALLLQRLRAHHRSLNGEAQHKPLSLTQLASDLGWNRSRVQRAMTGLFGPKPFTAYKERCKDRTIVDFLNQLPATGTHPVPPHACATV